MQTQLPTYQKYIFYNVPLAILKWNIYNKPTNTQNYKKFNTISISIIWKRKKPTICISYISKEVTSSQTTGREHSPTHQQKVGLKIYCAWPHPWEQDSDSPTVSLYKSRNFHKSFILIRGQTEWKPESQKDNQMITWTTALSNSMKLWAMLCRATQDGGEFWQNVVHCRREWQTTSVFLPWGPHEQYEKAKR